MLQRPHNCCAYRRGGVEGEHEHTPLCVSAQLQVNNMSFTYEYGEIGTATTRTWFLFLKSRHRPLWYPRTSRSQTWRHWDRERQARLETPEFISWDKNTTRTFSYYRYTRRTEMEVGTLSWRSCSDTVPWRAQSRWTRPSPSPWKWTWRRSSPRSPAGTSPHTGS